LFYDEHVAFILRIRFVLDTFGYDDNLSFSESDTPVTKFDLHFALQDMKHFVGVFI